MGKDGRRFVPEVPHHGVNAQTLLKTMLEEDTEFREKYSKYHKLRDDPRVTRVGHFLRKTSLDELPQIWNVLLGEISRVGSRRYLPREPRRSGFPRTRYCVFLLVSPACGRSPGATEPSSSDRVEMDARDVHDCSVRAGDRAPRLYRAALLFDRSADQLPLGGACQARTTATTNDRALCSTHQASDDSAQMPTLSNTQRVGG